MINLPITIPYERLVLTAVVILVGLLLLYILVRWIKRNITSLLERTIRYRVLWRAVIPILSLIILFIAKVNTPLLISEKELVFALNHVLNILIIIATSYTFINATRISRIVVLNRYDISLKDNLAARKIHTQLRIIERIVIFTILFIAFAAILMTFDTIRKLGISLFASAGIAGLILGLAAQKVIGSVLAGFQLAITQPIRIDDVVIVEGEWGWIEEIALTYVVVRLWDRRRLVVPSTYFIENVFQNWTRTSADILGTVFVFTDYTMPVGELRGEFEKILASTELWDGNIANVQVTNSTNHSLEVRFLMSAKDSPTLWDLRVLVRERLVEFMQKNYPDKLPITRIKLKE